MLVDSDVLIWLLRGNARALAAVSALPAWSISAVTHMELVQGCRSKTELRAVQKAFAPNANPILHITPAISEAACALVERHSLSHSLYMADALIAATALAHGLPLLTGNAKHFAPIAGLAVQTFKP